MTKTQLKYRVRSTPATLVTGSAGAFEIIATTPRDLKVEISRIFLAIPIGVNGSSLCADARPLT